MNDALYYTKNFEFVYFRKTYLLFVLKLPNKILEFKIRPKT